MIDATGLRKTFAPRGKAGAEVVAVESVDLHVAEGEIFGLLGPNGAGKSTTIRMLCTLLEPSGGTATVAGHDLLREPAAVRRRIGLVSQTGGVDMDETAHRELVHQAMIFGASKAAAVHRADELLDRFELTAAAHRQAKTMSGGQRRRLDVALGLVHRPTLLFLDEPTTGLDPQSRANLWEEVRRLRDEGTTVLITTHYLDEADALCDRLAIVDHGRKIIEGTADELKAGIGGDVVTITFDPHQVAAARDAIISAQITSKIEAHGTDGLRLTVSQSDTMITPLLRALDAAGVSTTTLATARPSLDDVFLQHTGRSLRDAA